MPRFALAFMLLPACFFDADYGHVRVTCSDGVCPSGLACVANVCSTPGDAAVGSGDAHVDAPPVHALTCEDPGAGTAIQDGSTMGHANQLSTMCGGVFYNGPDAVYQVDGSRQVTIKISGSYAVAAYVLGACTSQPTCETNTAAQPAAPLTITLGPGTHLVVVDGVNANLTGTYTLRIE